jgi:GntR family transcriptional regulator, rspAB operon transcriptional repressor
MHNRFSPLPEMSRKSLGEQVYEAMRESIVSLQLEPGRMIYENELAESMGVSRTPIREAIRLLVNEELLDVLPQRGTRVALISEQKVAETRFVREQLELGAFRAVAQAWDAERCQEVRSTLGHLLEQQQEAAISGDNARFLTLDETFHRTILELTNNRTLLQMVNAMRGHLNRIRYLALRQYHHMKPLVEEHEQLLKALETGDELGISQLLTIHFNKLDYQIPDLKHSYPQYFKP